LLVTNHHAARNAFKLAEEGSNKTKEGRKEGRILRKERKKVIK
jgi:hypothetical protein